MLLFLIIVAISITIIVYLVSKDGNHYPNDIPPADSVVDIGLSTKLKTSVNHLNEKSDRKHRMHHIKYNTASNLILERLEEFRTYENMPESLLDENEWRILIKNQNGKILAGQLFNDSHFFDLGVKPHEVDDLIEAIKSSYTNSGRSDRLSKSIFYSLIDVKRKGIDESSYPELSNFQEDDLFDFLLFLKKKRLYLSEYLYNKGVAIARKKLEDCLSSNLSYTEIKNRTRRLSVFIQLPMDEIESRKITKVKAAAGSESKMEELIRKRRNAKSRISKARKKNDEEKLQVELEKLQAIELEIERERKEIS